MPDHASRNAYIIKLVRGRRLSYSVIGEMAGVTRNVVAGLAFRDKHPVHTRIAPHGYPPYQRNMTGTGWQPKTYEPVKTLMNTH